MKPRVGRRLDLKKGSGSNHPDIDRHHTYLVRYDGKYYLGSFSREWYGWNFNGIYDAGAQYNQPGTNASRWEAIWEMEL